MMSVLIGMLLGVSAINISDIIKKYRSGKSWTNMIADMLIFWIALALALNKCGYLSL